MSEGVGQGRRPNHVESGRTAAARAAPQGQGEFPAKRQEHRIQNLCLVPTPTRGQAPKRGLFEARCFALNEHPTWIDTWAWGYDWGVGGSMATCGCNRAREHPQTSLLFTLARHQNPGGTHVHAQELRNNKTPPVFHKPDPNLIMISSTQESPDLFPPFFASLQPRRSVPPRGAAPAECWGRSR